MICYRDRTFCQFHEKCNGGLRCKIALTEKIKKEAEQYGLPVAIYAEPPECFDLIVSAVVVEETINSTEE